MSVIRTVLGDIAPTRFGVADYHEHLFQISRMLPGEELDDERMSRAEALLLHQAGVQGMVEATPTGLGRDPAAVARISAATGLAIVHATGLHHGGHYDEDHPLRASSVDALTARFVADVREGFATDTGAPVTTADGHAVRAGLTKAGARYWRIGPFERLGLEAAAATSAATGCAVMVHLDYGSAAHEVLDILSVGGAVPDRVVLAHIDRNLDPGLHAELAARGAYLGYDGMARHERASDAAILECLIAACAAGAASRILFGGDVARRSRYIAYGGMPGLAYLPERFLPRVRASVDEDVYRLLTVENPARLLAMPESTPRMETTQAPVGSEQ